MTLVVKKIIENRIYVHSDTRVSWIFNKSYLEKQPPLTGILKSIIISPEICFSFAGTVNHAYDALEKIFTENIFDIELLKNLLLSIHIESGQETDFSIATTKENPQLIQIKNGEIKDDLGIVWLGDLNAFKYFQQSYLTELNGLSNPSVDDLARLTDDAFEQTIRSEEEQTRSVGDFHMSIKTKDKKFKYQMKFRIHTGPQEIKFEKPGEWKDVPLGSAENGSYGESYLISETEHKPAVGIHFVHGNFGILFCPMVSRNAILIRGVKWGDQFTAKVKEDYGIHLGGFIYVEIESEKRLRESFDLGNKCAEQGDNTAALQHYNEALKIREAPEVLCNRGLSYMGTQQFYLAITDFTRAIELGFQNEKIYRFKGFCHGQKANSEKSEEEKKKAYLCFQKCVELDSSSIAREILSKFPEEWIKKYINL